MPPGTGQTWTAAGWDSGVAAARLQEVFPELALTVVEFRGESTLVVPADALGDALAFLRDDPATSFNFLTDLTAVHWPGRTLPFELVYLLYSFPRNVRLRVKVALGPAPRIPTVMALWPAADWLERECFDMFGVVFEGRADLRRILLPDGFDGHPLRKEFPLKC